MSWVAAAVTVGTAAYGAYNQYSNKKKAEGDKKNIFGSRPDIAPFTPLDLTAEEAKSVSGNLSNADSIEALLNRLVPNWSANVKQGTSNALAAQRGELTPEEIAASGRDSAQWAVQGGYAGAPMGFAKTLRDLGVRRREAMQWGANSAQQWANSALSNQSPWLSTGIQQAVATQQNNAGEQATKQYGFNVAAGADPGAAGAYGAETAANNNTANSLLAAGQAFGSAYGQRPRGTFNYSGTYGGQGFQYNPQTREYMPILQAQGVG